MPTTYDALIIGAGQAGLAAAHELIHRGLKPGKDCVILDANPHPGGAWQNRWDSLTLGKTHKIANLPQMKLDPPDPDTPASQAVGNYYGEYEEKFDLQVIRPVRIIQVRSLVSGSKDSPLEAIAENGQRWVAKYVLNATGTWENPYVPYISGAKNFRGQQLHTVDYTKAEDFAGKHVVVIGGGLSAVQFLLELEPVTTTTWATRRPPSFSPHHESEKWGRAIEVAVRSQTRAAAQPRSVVGNTGIPQRVAYVEGVKRGLLVSRGMFNKITEDSVIFNDPHTAMVNGVGPFADLELEIPESWKPYPLGTELNADVLFWNTGFRPTLRHLAPLKLHNGMKNRGIPMLDEVSPVADPRVFLVGYASTASTIGANRAGRLAGRSVAEKLHSSSA